MLNEKELPPLSEAQLEIMNAVWERGSCTVNDVLDAINLNRPVARNTVLTLMTRLADKGWLVQEKCGRGYLYRASQEKGQVQQSMVRRLMQAAFGGSPDGLIMAMVDDGALSADELDAIREKLKKTNVESDT